MNGSLSLGAVREALAAVLAPAQDGDPPVLIDYPDSVEPPALLVVWDDPWIEEPPTMGPKLTTANVVVLCVAARIDAGAGVETVEAMVAQVIDRLRADTNSWPLVSAQAPREWVIASVHYLGSRIQYRVPVTI